jgi:hypothetical protein
MLHRSRQLLDWHQRRLLGGSTTLKPKAVGAAVKMIDRSFDER